MDQYAVQDLVRRLQFLATKFESEGHTAKTIRDAIAYISKDKQ